MKTFIKKILRIKPKDPKVIRELKTKFIHNERSFSYGLMKHLVNCLYCHASPGVIETIILELEDLKKNKKITDNKLLNLGGGTGQVSKIFESLGFNVYNLDIDIKTPDKKNIQFDLNQNSPIPFDDKTFDIIICQEIVEHIENPWKMLMDAKRLLKNNGILIVTTPNILSMKSKLRFLFTGYFEWFTPACFDYHINPIPEWEIKLIASKNDFNIYKTKGSGDYYFDRDNTNYKKIIRKNESLIFFLKNDNN